jgi:hypothetical protein
MISNNINILKKFIPQNIRFSGVLFVASIFLTLQLVSNQSTLYARQINFAGVTWNVKTGGPMGPGPNYWSDDAKSVWLDDEGHLHLTIRYQNGNWYCSEVYTKDYTKFGKHRFLVEGAIDKMDKNIVLGLFLYANDNAEIDIEYSKWGSADYKKVGGYTIQPYTTSGNNKQFESPLDSTFSTHSFDWQDAYVSFASMQGLYYGAPPTPSYYIQQWFYNGADNPDESDNLRTHINFWLMNGNVPEDQSVLEVIIWDVIQPLTPTKIDNKSESGKPQSIKLNQNYPNPFNPETEISFELQDAAPVQLKIFDAVGRIIKTFKQENAQAGVTSVKWQGIDDSGTPVPGGIYFCRMQAMDMQNTIKMLLLQ